MEKFHFDNICQLHCLGNMHFWLLFFHWLDGYDHNFVPALRADVGLAAGAGKTVAARAVELLFVP